MAGASIPQNVRGLTVNPSMDYEGTIMSTGTSLFSGQVFGHGNPTTLHSITVNTAPPNGMQLNVFQKTNSTTSVNMGNIQHNPNAAGLTLWYDVVAPAGWIINLQSAGCDLTVVYREYT